MQNKDMELEKITNVMDNIEQFENDDSFALFNAQMDDTYKTMIIKINLNRAVIEYTTFFRQFIRLLLLQDVKHYILDFSDTVFLDSSFLGSIIYFFKRVNAKRGRLSLVIDYSKVKILSEVFELGYINIYSSLKEAKADI